MNLLKLLKSYSLTDVFTPNTAAKLTYVKRKTLENDLEKYVSLPGKQIVIYGHSGSGKTTLIRNKLKSMRQNYIKTHCESKTTFNELLLNAFDALNRFYVSEKSSNNSYTIGSDLKNDYLSIKSSIYESQKTTKSQKEERIVPPQLTPEKLAFFLGEIDSVWIIEDFHKIEKDEKRRIADVVKIFIDCANDYNNVKVICIGAVGTARELIELDSNLNNRIAEVLVPLLTENEIKEIIEKGCKLLNLNVEENLVDKISYYSNNLASVTHQICYDICFDKKIVKSKIFPQTLKNESFKTAVNSFVKKNSDTYSKTYDSIICSKFGWNILKSFEHSEKEYLSFEEIRNSIPKNKKPKNEQDLLEYLTKLTSSDFNNLLRYDQNSEKYSISTPFFRAFLKMKMAIEKSEINERKRKRKNKRDRKYEIDPDNVNEKLVLSDEFFKDFNDFLETYINNEIKKKK